MEILQILQFSKNCQIFVSHFADSLWSAKLRLRTFSVSKFYKLDLISPKAMLKALKKYVHTRFGLDFVKYPANTWCWTACSMIKYSVFGMINILDLIGTWKLRLWYYVNTHWHWHTKLPLKDAGDNEMVSFLSLSLTDWIRPSVEIDQMGTFLR